MINKTKKILVMLLLFTLPMAFLQGCLKKEAETKAVAFKPVELVYYKLFDDEDVMKPMIQQYQATHPTVTIKYKKFDSTADYYRTILNNLAEGEGPDIFSVPNYWLLNNSRKLTPMPADYYAPKTFADTFVSVAANDCIFADPRDGVSKVFAIPLSVDTLALYYNKSLFEDKIPSRGKPATTWTDFKDDVFKLTKADNSFERFELAGTAMGRADNIGLSVDILYMLMLQYKTSFYNDGLTLAQFAKQQAIGENGVSINPATEALKLYTSFGLASQKNYSWNEYMVESNSTAKELEAFARGKVATIFGYSYTLQQIKDEIEQLKKLSVNTINPDFIKLALVPQVNDPSVSTEKRDAFANYYVETVGRNSEHADVAWDFLQFISSKDNLAYYNQKTHRPTSRRDMIEEQKQDAVYGVFAEQVGFAESFPIYDWDIYKQNFSVAINAVLNTAPVKDSISKAEEAINKSMPPDGILPPAPIKPVTKATTAPATAAKTTTTTTPAK